MKKEVLIGVLVIICLIPGCIKKDDGAEQFDEDGALEFGLKIVETYFTNDMEEFKSYLDDEIFTLEGDGPFSRSEVISFLDEDDYVADEEYPEHTYQEYLDTYKPYVMDVDEVDLEFEGLVGEMKEIGWDFDDDDYIFMGWETSSGDEEDGFLWDDPLAFGITHEDGKWAFKAFSG